jgi:hypothetical protein
VPILTRSLDGYINPGWTERAEWVLDCHIVRLRLVLFITYSAQLCIYLVTYNIIILPSLDVEANNNYNQMIGNLLEDYPKL